MDSLLKSALEGLDNEESISIAPKRKAVDNGGKDLKKNKPSVPDKDDGDNKEPDAKEEDGPKDASWNWTPKAYNGGGAYQQRPPYGGGYGGGYQQRPPYNGGGGYQQRPPYNGGGGYGGYQQRPPYNGGGGGYQQRPPYNGGGGYGGYQQRPPYGGGGGFQRRFY